MASRLHLGWSRACRALIAASVGIATVIAVAAPASAVAGVITGISPSQGTANGGTTVKITGTGFANTVQVRFGTENALSFTLVNSTTINAVSPFSPAGTVDITTVKSGGAISAITPADQYTFVTPACTFNGQPPSTLFNTTAGSTTIAVSCVGLPANTNMYMATASPLVGILTPYNLANQEALLMNGGGLPPSVTSDANGTMSTTQTVPSVVTGTDHDAVCPPSQAQVNEGLLDCAFAVADINGVNYGNALLAYPSTPNPQTPVLNLTPGTGTAGDSISVSGHGWWGTAISGGFVGSDDISVDGQPSASGELTVAAPTYTENAGHNGGTFTGSVISGSFTIPDTWPSGAQTVAIDEGNRTLDAGNGPNNTVEGTQSLTVIGSNPAISGVSPSDGPTSGGTSVTITGGQFTGATAVDFGSTAATSFNVDNDGQITAVAPAESAGTVDITVATPGGTSAITSADQYTYVVAPTVTGVSPTTGSTAGGTAVTIAGSGFTNASAVSFGATAATDFNVDSDGQITATSPAGSAGTVDITVTTDGGTSATSSADQYTYVVAPSVTNVSPNAGPTGGGTTVTISGSQFTGATAVDFGSTAATSFHVDNDGQITAVAPAESAGTVDITVTAPGGTSATGTADQYTYVAAPTVTNVLPNSGPLGGGTSVTITGTGFTGASAVHFGGSSATTFTVNNDTSITASSPARSAGTVDVTVTTAGGTSATGGADQFTYVAAPTVTNVSPNSGPTGGGTSVTITGTGFTGASAVNFGGTAATTFHVDNDGQITATSPAESAGTVDVTVTTTGGTSATSAPDQFTYVAAPTVTSVSPNSGPLGGGTSVTITGTGFTGASAVHFGGSSATTFTVNSDTSITTSSPAEGAGTVDVTVITIGGTSATSGADQFTYVAAPTVTNISPNTGPTGGGTSVTITGTGFTGASAVNFGSSTATTFTINDDTSITASSPAEGAGTVDVTVTSPGGTSATGTSDQFTFTAPAGCSGVCVSVGDVAAEEGDAGSHALTFDVTLTNPATVLSTVQYTVVGGTATGGSGTHPPAGTDFILKSGTLTFKPGLNSGISPVAKTIAVTVLGDTTVEPDETFTVVLSNPTGQIQLARAVGTGTILNDDPGAGVTMGIGDASAALQASGTQTLKIPVTLSTKVGVPITVTYTITPGTATNSAKATSGGDFGGKLTGTFNFGKNVVMHNIAIPIWPHVAAQPDKSFTITLTSATGSPVTIIRVTGTGTILGHP
jgi:hypothetical protein